ncbi:MAG: type II secretion system F family protein [Pseudohongiellaceae bacterium]
MSTLYFRYQAYDSAGKVRSGVVDADSEREAVKLLQSKQLIPIKVQLTGPGGGRRRRKIRHADVLDFTNGLSTLVDARVPIDKALRLLEGITESQAMRELVVNMRREVKEGKGLADALEARPDVFSRMYVNIVRAGEEGGILHQLLPGLAEFLESNAKTRQSIVASMIYPVVLLITGIVSVALLLVFVVPQFAALFEDAGTDMPATAAFLLSLSSGIQSYGYLVLVFIALMVFGWKWLDRDPSTKLQKDQFLLSLPLLGELILYRDCAVFSRTLGSLLGAGIPLIRSLRIAREVVANTDLTGQLRQVEEDVRGGAGLGISLEKTNRFPTLLHQLVTVGEESGRTASILLKIAATFDNHVRNQLSALVSTLQPALIIFLAIAVGGITITMLSAVFSMNAVEF